MSVAPSSAYQTNKAQAGLASGSTTFSQTRDLLLAKFLQNTTPVSDWKDGDGYFNSTDTEAEKIAKIKDIFKIDGWKRFDSPQLKTGTITISGTSCTGSGTSFTTDFVVGRRIGAVVNGICVETYIVTAITSNTAMSVVAGTNRTGIACAQMIEGFVGYCTSKTSGNGLYHNWDNNTSPFIARGSGVKLDTTTISAELLNDAGLNRKPVVTAGSGTNTLSDLGNNGFKISATFESTFYNSIESYGVKWRKQGDTPYNTINLGTIGVKDEEVKSEYSIDVDATDTLYVEAPNIYEINAYATTSEGETLVALNNVTIVPITLSLYYGTTRENAYANGTAVNYYKNRRLDEGATLYDDINATQPVDAGFYMDKSGSAPYFYYECDANGVVIGFGEYNPSVARVLYSPSGWGSTEENAITDANSTSWVPKYTIYLDTDGYWYANSTGITLANDGYWLVGDSELSYESIHLIDGIQVF
jgi:hypothetical protein